MSISVNDVVEAQAHIGTLKSEAHPKTNKYWAGVINNLAVINPESIIEQIETAKAKILQAKADGKEILVVSEKKMYADELEKLGEKYGFNYLNYKLPSGFLTNFETLKKRIESMNTMARFVGTENYLTLTKKEQLVYKRKLERVLKIYKGVKNLSRKPELVIVLDGQMMDNFINEITKTPGVQSIIIAGTNFSRRWAEDSIILANVSSHKSVDFVLNNMFKA
ncbi:MAG: 30S ribosomal protein S2 [uncultured bacterium (gcode 4)]|uniref:Small ribosomal subunit protein uS2 n=1 Tax=uncultured bacterium (gcode 4) TaxID=1234023 RepID=K1XIN8_9BACT|nr:MAG: 30S ribosomal protein S2 [uncultured bacterium (gcode 4)]HBB04891.1 30S ribosomal protein S2 [Candidatus Gracilibacteria bacterium]